MLTPRRIACANWPSPIEARIAVARDAEIDQVAVGEVGAGQHRRHAAVHRVEAVRVAEEVVGVFDEQPMPEILATRCGSIESSKQASMMAA